MVVLVVVLALLAIPASAGAKELTGLDVCGATSCGRVTNADALDAFMRSDDRKARAPSGPQRSYLIRVRVREESGRSIVSWRTRWLPAAGVLAYEESAGRFAFTRPDRTLVRALRGAARGRPPRAARSFSSVSRAGMPLTGWIGAIALLIAGAGVLVVRTR